MDRTALLDDDGGVRHEVPTDAEFVRDDRPVLPRGLRLRERLERVGAARLPTLDLVEIVVGTDGRRGGQAVAARRGVRARGVRAASQFDLKEWRSLRGVGAVASTRLVAAFELGRRALAGAAADDRPKITRPSAAFRYVRDLGSARKEQLVGLYLDSQNGLVHRETISVGSLNTTRTHPREILLPAVEHLALGFVLAHNHPSGCLEPSPEDFEFTRAVRHAGELMGIELYDHLIVAGRGWVSLRERGAF